ncbi:hypothetical protein FisN_28Hh099 [Fistulifera solaris]|uniref:Uncharacterized protein n=1 Tax=Fistulifera solaris TaxID=1519565 RepID=A0A1Z5KH19_FISSO|nr:hypothetical protein FisN_28Hh099 [Fistulifera solaris]|eukprot:GAX25620.1 hypothetical protein FisN_28Hh099 [Fistulifera solaris]
MKSTNQEPVITNHQLPFDESYSSHVSVSSDNDDESPIIGMTRLLRRNKKDAKKDGKKKEKKSNKSSSKKLFPFERKSKEKSPEQISSESSLTEESDKTSPSGVIKESAGKLKELKEKWEQQAAENQRNSQSSPRATTEQAEEPEHFDIRKHLDLWEHRLSENSPLNGGSPQSRDPSQSRCLPHQKFKIERDHRAPTAQPSAPPQRNELRDAFISLAFAAFMIGIAMLIHQPYGPYVENGIYGIFPTAAMILGKVNEFGDLINIYTEYLFELMQQWKGSVLDAIDKWSSNGSEALQPPTVPSDARHFLLL